MAILAGLAEATEEEPDLWNAVMAMFPNAVAAFAFLVFNLLDSPCLAAISTMSQEMNSKKMDLGNYCFPKYLCLCSLLDYLSIRLRIYWWTSFFRYGLL